MEDAILLCEDSIEGILTGVYEAYLLKKDPSRIHLQTGENQNYCLFTTYQEITADLAKSERVLHTIYRKLGEEAYRCLCEAMLSYEADKADAVYHAIVTGLSGQFRSTFMEHLSDPHIHRVFALSRNTWNEIDHFRGFLRFEELKNGALFARFQPKNDILTMLMPHFSNRLPNEDFAIYDEDRSYYGVHPKGMAWYLVRGEHPLVPAPDQYSEAEWHYQTLFRHFCQSIAITERKNTSLQRNLLPLRFRGHMTEFHEETPLPTS